MDRKIVFVDVDDVCALLSPVWLGLYNKDYNDNLTVEDIEDWDIHKFVKPECGLKIYDYLKIPTLYDDVPPREGALDGVKALRELGFRVVFATSTVIEVAGRKFYWLRDWGFVEKRKDYIEINDKSLLHGDFMFDDSYDNVRGFIGVGYLLDRPWNLKKTWRHRISSWNDFIRVMRIISSWS